MNNSLFILFNNREDCIDFSNEYAPEHLLINTIMPWELAEKVKMPDQCLSENLAVSAGDYASGTNHTLRPTAMQEVTAGVC